MHCTGVHCTDVQKTVDTCAHMPTHHDLMFSFSNQCFSARLSDQRATHSAPHQPPAQPPSQPPSQHPQRHASGSFSRRVVRGDGVAGNGVLLCGGWPSRHRTFHRRIVETAEGGHAFWRLCSGQREGKKPTAVTAVTAVTTVTQSRFLSLYKSNHHNCLWLAMVY